MAIDIRLVFLCPPLIFIAMQACFSAAAEFTYDQWLFITDIPICTLRRLRTLLIPPDIFVDPDNIECLAKRIVHNLGVALRAHQQSSRNQPRGIE